MKLQRVYAKGVPEPPPGYWSNCKKAGNLVFLSGLVALDENKKVIAPADACEQASYIFSCMSKYLESAGGGINDLAKMTVYLTDIRDRPAFYEARQRFFEGDFPCSTLIEIGALIDPRLLVEIEGIAVLGTE